MTLEAYDHARCATMAGSFDPAAYMRHRSAGYAAYYRKAAPDATDDARNIGASEKESVAFSYGMLAGVNNWLVAEEVSELAKRGGVTREVAAAHMYRQAQCALLLK